MDRLDLQNSIFADDIRLERIVLLEEKPIVVTSQPAIKGRQAPPEAIDRMMVDRGYERLDLAPRNVLLSADGDLYPIDPVIQRIDQEFGRFLREHPHTINLPR